MGSKTYQTYNKKTKAWIKYKKTNKGTEILDMKQKEPKKPFKGIKKK